MHVFAKLTAIALLLLPPLAHAAPPSDPPAPRIEGLVTTTGASLWDGLHNSRVTLTMRTGEELDGTIVAQDDAQLAFARSADGLVVAIPKREVQSVRLFAEPSSDVERPTDDGRKHYGWGIALLSLGVPLGVAGTVLLGFDPASVHVNLPLLVPGIALTVGGSVALKRSYARLRAHRKAWGLPQTSKLQLAPALNVHSEGGQLGLVMRF